MLFYTACLLLTCLNSPTEADATQQPRMIFTDKEVAMKHLPLPEHHAPVWIVLGGDSDTVTAAGQKHLISFTFENPQKAPVERRPIWEDCTSTSLPQSMSNYNITVIHERKNDQRVFMCGTNDLKTVCCDMNLSEQSPMSTPSVKLRSIAESIEEFIIKGREPSALVESTGSADLYLTYSGSGEYVGIHKFGGKRVGPASQNKEQHYVGLVVSTRKDDPLQDKVYAFYNEKNRDTDLYSSMWLPFVSQVCMADIGGPKSNLQFTWTSQMNARLFCGDPHSRQRFSELVDIATVHADRWQDTRVYALFRNEWSMTAVCVFTIQDIDHVFTTSPFKGGQRDGPRACVSDSTKIPLDALRMIKEASEMKQWVQPEKDFGPLLFKRHVYTHIAVDTFQHRRNDEYPVLFLSLNHGGIHKVINNKNQTFVISEYQPFDSKTHILSILLHPSSRKLYVNSRSEMIQIDVAHCAQHGETCEECVLARDPYCGWTGSHCSPETRGAKQDVVQGDHAICNDHVLGKVFAPSTDGQPNKDVVTIKLPTHSKYFLQCPVSSHHAKYTWYHNESPTQCSSRDHQCLLLINGMGPEQEGNYTCVSKEMGYSRVLAIYQLQLKSRAAGLSSSPQVWLSLTVILIKSLSH
ncbi:semaphorin-7A-like [Brachionichthys hirsutus]|uniref:semaphorin-7A-like n=1 Tax=Brachionichthys hirsutus TaxID=412623 RepID=UPI003604E1F4